METQVDAAATGAHVAPCLLADDGQQLLGLPQTPKARLCLGIEGYKHLYTRTRE